MRRVPIVSISRGLSESLKRSLHHGSTVFVLPAAFLIILIVAFPFGDAIWISLTNHEVANPVDKFVGLANYAAWVSQASYWHALINTVVYSLATVAAGLVLGLAIGLSLNKLKAGRDFWGALILVPWIVPTVVSTLIWSWMYNPVGGVLNYVLKSLLLTRSDVNWLGRPTLALISVIVVSAWRYTPYFGVVILAGRKQVADQLYEAAVIDGASGFQQFWKVTLPSLRSVLLLTGTLIFVRVMYDFIVVYVLTKGGPGDATQILTVLSFTVAFDAGKMGSGVAAPMLAFPILAPIIFIVSGNMVKNLVGAK